MPRISVLPEHIASQIAAGEVVERPASVVKELVENSIDAGASRIVIDVNEGCRSIRVADNGCGMEPGDAALAFQRHATSKLTTAEDLWSLHTLGFRGEALPSIASISRLTCYTRTENKSIGTKLTCLDGSMTVNEFGCARGTIIEIEELFYNVPARLKFLKKASTEFANIQEIVQSLAITYPAIGFHLSLDGNTRLITHGSDNLDQALSESGFFSQEQNLISLSARDGVLGLEVTGRLASALHFRGDRKGILTIVNSRPVRCPLTYKALDYAYADLIPRGRYPLAVVHLTVNPAELDINIHPTKKEIRYSKGNEVYLFMQRQIAHALRIARNIHAGVLVNADSSMPESASTLDFNPLAVITNLSTAGEFLEPATSIASEELSAFNYLPTAGKQLSLRDSADSLYISSFSSDHSLSPPFALSPGPAGGYTSSGPSYQSDFDSALSSSSIDMPASGQAEGYINIFPKSKQSALPLDWQLAGYIGNTYILIESKSGLSIVEQHIAHERVLYERLLSRIKKTDTEAPTTTLESPLSEPDYRQNLLISLPLSLTAEQKSVLEEHLSELSNYGFTFEINDQDITCSQVPLELAHKDYASIIQAMLQALVENSSVDPQLEIIKSLACQSAIKNGQPLFADQIIELLNLWYKAPRNETCPHGRPIELIFSYDNLFQLFHPD